MSKNNIYNLVYSIGRLIGLISKIIPQNYFFLIKLYKEGFYTERQKKCFNYLGKGSRLSPDMLLIHPKYVSIGKNCHFEPRVILETNKIYREESPIIKIGDDCSFGEYTHITCCNKIVIGNGLLTGRFVLITDNSHGKSSLSEIKIKPVNRKNYSKGKIVIGNNVWIGDKVTILSNVNIGNSCIIGANSVVACDIPDNVVVAGCPAKIIKYIDQ